MKKKKPTSRKKNSRLTQSAREKLFMKQLENFFNNLETKPYSPSFQELDEIIPVYAGGPDGINGFGPYGDS